MAKPGQPTPPILCLRSTLRDNGGLADIAPTLLQILGLPQPAAMTGQSLIAPMSNMDPTPKTARLPLSV